MSVKRKRDFNGPSTNSLPVVTQTKNLRVETLGAASNTKYESTFMWKIRMINDQTFYSPTFTSFVVNNLKINWSLIFCRSKDYYDIHLECLDSVDFTCMKEMKIKTFIMDKNNVPCNFRETKVEIIDYIDQISFKDFVSLEDLFNENKGLIIKESLTIVCTIIFGKGLAIEDFSIYDSSMCHRLKEFDNFEKLLESDKFSDVKLIVESKEICAHKCVLSMRSCVFSAMFEHNMKERQENVIQINDIKYEVMKEVLRYIYAGKVNNINDLAKDLLAAADKYEIDGLKSICEQVLIRTTNIENIDKMLLLVDLYNVDSLKGHAFNFLNDNAKKIVNTPSFKLVLKSLSPTMLAEVLQFVLKYKQ